MKKNLKKAWERCKSIGRGRKEERAVTTRKSMLSRSKTWGHSREPEAGCFSVYVGSEMQRFVIKTEYANHPLFRTLLEEAESEYGHSARGPLSLPCEVDMFHNVLMEIHTQLTPPPPPPPRRANSFYCPNFLNRSPSSYHRLLTPS